MDVPNGVENLIGNRYGRLTVIDYMGMNSSHATLWLCECDCGREKVVQRTSLLNGTTRRCGRNCPFDTGMMPGRSFGALTLLHRLNDSKTQSDELWLCECECGNRIEVTTRKLRRGVVTSCGCGRAKHAKTGKRRGNVNDTTISELTDVPKANNTTGVRGVSKYADGRYHATITFRKRKYSLGSFARLDDAAAVRAECERLIFGPAIKSNGESFPSPAECNQIVSDVRQRYADAQMRRVADSY